MHALCWCTGPGWLADSFHDTETLAQEWPHNLLDDRMRGTAPDSVLAV